MGLQRQNLVILEPQPVLAVANVAQRITTTSTIVRSVTISAADGNKDDMFIAPTEAQVITLNRITIIAKGGIFLLNPDPYGNLETLFDIRELWFTGKRAGDRLVVSFVNIKGVLE